MVDKRDDAEIGKRLAGDWHDGTVGAPLCSAVNGSILEVVLDSRAVADLETNDVPPSKVDAGAERRAPADDRAREVDSARTLNLPVDPPHDGAEFSVSKLSTKPISGGHIRH